MDDTNTGGPAFPAHTIAIHQGTTLRDYFAAKAMHAMLAQPNRKETVSPQVYASAAYHMADAMLEARK